MSNQQTLKQSASFSGIGLHSGNRVTMTFLPAPANSGIRFRRMDLDGRPEIEARIENVSETNRRVKTYTLTPQGRQQLKAELTRWHMFASAITRVLDARRPRLA